MTANKKTKLPSAKAWAERHIDDWNVSTFTSYLTDKHRQMFGIDYAPFRGWRTEQGMIGRIIGTSGKNAKPRIASNANVKRFIDETFANYRPTPEYPGVNFGWVWSFRRTDWQRICAESLAQEKRAEAVKETDIDEISDWFAK